VITDYAIASSETFVIYLGMLSGPLNLDRLMYTESREKKRQRELKAAVPSAVPIYLGEYIERHTRMFKTTDIWDSP